jgi:hypothetical protein
VGDVAETPLRKFVTPGLALVETLHPELEPIDGLHKANTIIIATISILAFGNMELSSLVPAQPL